MQKKVLIVIASFYEDISDILLDNTKKYLQENGTDFDVIQIDGALEIASVINFAKEKYDGFVALGCVIRGQTSHYDYVCENSVRDLCNLALKENLVIGNGILTVENRSQALDRAKKDGKNKGAFAAKVCLDLINIKKQFES